MCSDQNCTQLLDDILQQLGIQSFSSDESPAYAKNTAIFLSRIARASPRNVLRNAPVLENLLESESHPVRMCVLEIFGILIQHLTRQEERTPTTKRQIESFISYLKTRLLDINSFVRCRVLHVLSELVLSGSLPVSQRREMIGLVSRRVRDKSSNVRKKSIQLLGETMRTHPFLVDGGELSEPLFRERLAEVDLAIAENTPKDVSQSLGFNFAGELNDTSGKSDDSEENSIPSLDHDDSRKFLPGPKENSVESSRTLLLQKQYYTDAIAFVEQLHQVIPDLVRLLSSNTKMELFEVMDFFVDAYIYKLKNAQLGVTKMLHLVWEKDLSGDDGSKRSVREHVLTSFRKVYLDVDASLTPRERTMQVARSLITLVNDASPADLASLEEIIRGCITKGWITDALIGCLSSIFAVTTHHDTRPSIATASGSQKEVLNNRRGSLVLLTFVGAAKPEVIRSRIEIITRKGLGARLDGALPDPWIVEYSCIALRLITGESVDLDFSRLANENVVLSRLSEVIKNVPASPRWLQVTSQAVRTIYSLAERPDLIAANILKDLCVETLRLEGGERTAALIKALFLAGHIATSEVANLEALELKWKDIIHAQKSSRKSSNDKLSKKDQKDDAMQEDDEITMINGGAEEGLSEAVRFVRESELLFGSESALALLSRMAVTVCANNTLYPDALLQNVAATTLAKFMTVSDRFCREHLSLFLTILERSRDASIRSNLTVAFADIAQVFGRVVDANVIYLFRRLRDSDVSVRRTALMVLTHLTLTGMIKVKGQVGEVARCILDADERIAELARVFFQELAAKDSASIYNHIPDILSTLSFVNGTNRASNDGSLNGATPSKKISEEDFCQIARFIFDFVRKERQMEGLVEKLCQRFRQCSTPRQARDLAYCLTLVNYTSERTLRRLIVSLPLYRERLTDSRTSKYFMEIISKVRRGTAIGATKNVTVASGDLKLAIDEYEERVKQAAGNTSEYSNKDESESDAEIEINCGQAVLQKNLENDDNIDSKCASKSSRVMMEEEEGGKGVKNKNTIRTNSIQLNSIVNEDGAKKEINEEEVEEILSGEEELPTMHLNSPRRIARSTNTSPGRKSISHSNRTTSSSKFIGAASKTSRRNRMKVSDSDDYDDDNDDPY